MPHLLHVVDAFTNKAFSGNPAAVCVLEAPADEAWMKLVAREMNLSETAFLHPVEGGYSLRWLTPTVEVKLCGHATLASARVLWETGKLRPEESAHFKTLSGWLTCRRDGDWIEMDFPAQAPGAAPAPDGLGEALGCKFLWTGRFEAKHLVEVADEATLRSLKPDFKALTALSIYGVIVTCRGQTAPYDFMSRYFAPGAGIDEDPVTGSAHCILGPYWQAKLGKADFTAYQASQRGGEIRLRVEGERVLLRGQTVLMSTVEFHH